MMPDVPAAPASPHALIFTHGACRNPGPGGWGAVTVRDGVETSLSGQDPATTNIRMELTAAIRAIEELPEGVTVTLTTSSEYLVSSMTKWLSGYRARGWVGVKNADLVQRLAELAEERGVAFVWAKGHGGHPARIRAEGLAAVETERAAQAVGWTPASKFGFGAAE